MLCFPHDFIWWIRTACLSEGLFWSLGACYLRHSRVLQSGSDCLMNLLYLRNQRRAGNTIKESVCDCNNSSSDCRVSPLEAIVEGKLLLLWKYNDFLLQISKKKHLQVSGKENSIFTAGGGTLRHLSCLSSLASVYHIWRNRVKGFKRKRIHFSCTWGLYTGYAPPLRSLADAFLKCSLCLCDNSSSLTADI